MKLKGYILIDILVKCTENFIRNMQYYFIKSSEVDMVR